MTSTAPEVFEISRVFEAPRDLVFEAWTDATHLKQWFGPKGTKLGYATVELRPGGMFHYKINFPDGQVIWAKWVYTDVQHPDKLAWVFSFSDENGATARSPFSQDFPLELSTTVTFTDEGNGRTRVTMHSVPRNATEAERAVFGSMNQSMTKGWSGTLDQFDEFLANAIAASGSSGPRPA